MLQALSAHFDVTETRTTPDGPVRTRLYQKFGLVIRESIHLPPEEEAAAGESLAFRPGEPPPNGNGHYPPPIPDRERQQADQADYASGGSERADGHVTGLLGLAEAIKPPPQIASRVERPAPSVVAPIRESLEELQALLADDISPGAEPEKVEALSIAAPALEPLERPPLAVYAVLSHRRIALVGFPEEMAGILRWGFEDQFSQVTILDWGQFDPADPEVLDQELIILRLELDEDGRRLDALASMDKPTLIAGDREHLVQLNPEFAGTPFDFVAYPCRAIEVVWRGANLLARADARAEIKLVAKAPEPPEEEEPATSTVLIADDDPATAALLETVLTGQGMECLIAQNGQDAIEMARQGRVRAAILEVGLPGLDGFQILAELKRDPVLAKGRVIFLTARQSEQDILRAFGLGADDYITKPFSPMEVAARIRRLLARNR